MSAPSVNAARRASFLTVCGLLAIAGLIAMPLLAGEPVDGRVNQWGRYLGHFHPAVLHLPIGMLALVLLLEFGQLFRKDKRSTLVPVFFTAVSSIVAVICGFLLYQSMVGEYDTELVVSHLWWSTGFAAAMVAVVMLKAWIDAAGGVGNWLYVLALVASGGAMTVASHAGGSLTHGKTYLSDEAPNPLREIYNQLPFEEKLPMLDEQKGSEPKAPEAPSGPDASRVPEDAVVYDRYIQPIFDQKCIACHGEEKQKGKFRMDSYDAVIAGGKEGDGLEPGDAENSNIVYRIELPEDDEEHMAPEGKKQIDANELAVIKWWIDSGASRDATVGALAMPEAVKLAASVLVTPEAAAEMKAEAARESEEEADERAEVAKRVEALQAEFPSALDFESQQSPWLTFTAVSMRADFGDEHLRKLAPVMDSIVSLDLSATQVTDEGIRALAEAKVLRMLRLAETAVSDDCIEALADLPELESLNLYGTRVTSAGATKLVALPKLKRLYLWQTQVDEQGAEDLRRQMPECEVVMGL